MSDLELQKGKTEVGKQGVRFLYLCEITNSKLNSDLENLQRDARYRCHRGKFRSLSWHFSDTFLTLIQRGLMSYRCNSSNPFVKVSKKEPTEIFPGGNGIVRLAVRSFSVMYRFVGLRHELTKICSINQKHRSNWTVTLISFEYG